MGKLIQGDDGLLAEEVGPQAKQKHEYLRRYLDISKAARKRFLDGLGGATYIDLYCSTGRARVKGTHEWIDGSTVAAWKISRESNTPYTAIYVADADPARRAATVERLRRLNAPVQELQGTALEAARLVPAKVNKFGLHFAFLDPYNLGSLDFGIIEELSSLKRMDMLIHVSAMDLQRNLVTHIHKDESEWDCFAPGWRDHIPPAAPQRELRRYVMEYWRSRIASLGVSPGGDGDVKMITGSQGQYLYWLLLAARHELAHRFWKIAVNPEGQGSLF